MKKTLIIAGLMICKVLIVSKYNMKNLTFSRGTVKEKYCPGFSEAIVMSPSHLKFRELFGAKTLQRLKLRQICCCFIIEIIKKM